MDIRIQIVISLMKDNLHQQIPLDELASVAGLSPSRFHHLFKAETGTSPARYLCSLRIEHAKELLKSSPLSVKQVLVSVGIIDRSHFDRKFKQAYGVTPAQYRTDRLYVGMMKKDFKNGQQKRP